MIYALTLSYRGGAYAGWQRQVNALSVQQVVEEALADLVEHPVRIHGASRTDAGVHARGQVAHVTLDHEFPMGGLHHGTNQRLPEDIRVMGVSRMAEGFHARKSAKSKEYRYRLIEHRILSPLDALFAISVPAGLDLERMVEATDLLVGTHDFSAFALAGGSHGQPFRSILRAGWSREGAMLELHLEGDGFLRGMVRSIVGTLLEIGRGRMSTVRFEALLTGRPRSEAGPTAPARALVLHRVFYPEGSEVAVAPSGEALC